MKLNRVFTKAITWAFLAVCAVYAGSAAAVETVVYYHNDALGSPVAATDEQGEVLWREAYSPYGDRLRKEDGGSNSLWYTAKPHEADFDLTYSGARWYMPATGRFTGIDPVGFQEDYLHSFNRYIYANNNPYKYVDPDGRFGLLLHSLQQGVSLEQAQTISGFGNGALAASASVAAAGVLVATPGPDELLIGAGLGTIRAIGVTTKTTQSGIGVTRHSVMQKINRQVKSADELDAIKNPLDVRPIKVDTLGRPSQRFVGRKAEVARNPQTGDIVSVNPTSTKKAERLLGRQGGQ